jgi:hypothetical protein
VGAESGQGGVGVAVGGHGGEIAPGPLSGGGDIGHGGVGVAHGGDTEPGPLNGGEGAHAGGCGAQKMRIDASIRADDTFTEN